MLKQDRDITGTLICEHQRRCPFAELGIHISAGPVNSSMAVVLSQNDITAKLSALFSSGCEYLCARRSFERLITSPNQGGMSSIFPVLAWLHQVWSKWTQPGI